MTQKELVLKHLQHSRHITPVVAMGMYKIHKLATIIGQLKNDGHNIVRTTKDDIDGRPYSVYTLEPKTQTQEVEGHTLGNNNEGSLSPMYA